MRFSYLLISLLLIGGLSACGSEELMIPPTFSNVMVNDVDIKILTPSFNVQSVTITGNISDSAVIIVGNNSTLTAETPVTVNSDGSWILNDFPLSTEGVNTVTLTASDPRGNINQLRLTVTRDTTAPVVSLVTQSLVDPLKLTVTFNEDLLDTSVATSIFTVVTDGISLTLTADPFNPLTPRVVTLPLSVSLAAGLHQLTCVGVTDRATLGGNSVSSTYTFDFTTP